MNLREAAQQALEALEMSTRFVYADNRPQCENAINALRAALEPVTTCHELYETACANATYKVIDYFCHTTACSDVNVTYIRKIIDEFAEQAICCKGGDKLSPSSNHIGDTDKMVNECDYPDCALTEGCVRQCPAYPITNESLVVLDEDRSADTGKTSDNNPDATKMVAISQESRQVEPVAWMVYTLDGQSAFVTDNPADFTPEHRALPLYTSPPTREPLTDDEINNLELPPNGCTMRELVRVVERVHGIGGEE